MMKIEMQEIKLPDEDIREVILKAEALAAKQFPYEVINWDIGLQKHSNQLRDFCRCGFVQGYLAKYKNNGNIHNMPTSE